MSELRDIGFNGYFGYRFFRSFCGLDSFDSIHLDSWSSKLVIHVHVVWICGKCQVFSWLKPFDYSKLHFLLKKIQNWFGHYFLRPLRNRWGPSQLSPLAVSHCPLAVVPVPVSVCRPPPSASVVLSPLEPSSRPLPGDGSLVAALHLKIKMRFYVFERADIRSVKS